MARIDYLHAEVAQRQASQREPMAPVIVTQIHAAVNRRHVKDQGLFSVRGGGWGGGWAGGEQTGTRKKVYQRLA